MLYGIRAPCVVLTLRKRLAKSGASPAGTGIESMKALLLSVAALLLIPSRAGLAQGTVTFIASGSSRPIQWIDADYISTNKFAVGSPSFGPPGFGMLNIAIYGASQGTAVPLGAYGIPDLSGWVLAAPILHNITAIPGNVVGTTVTMDASLGAPGTPVQMMVVGWTGNAPDWNSATPFGAVWFGWTGSAHSGGSLGWTQLTGTPTTAQVMATGPGGFNGLVLEDYFSPEPGSIAIGALSMVILFLFRRKK